MDILTAAIYIVLFIIMMIFIFSIGMLKPFMPKKEVALVLACAFVIGCIGGVFFLSPLYDEVPEVVSTFEKVVPTNNETMFLDLSSASDIDGLKENLTKMDGVYSFEETGIKLNTDKLKLIDTLSGSSRKNSYPNGDIVYNNTSLYLADVSIADESSLKGDSETKRLKFFNLNEIPKNIMDADLINAYKKYCEKWFGTIY